MHRNLYNFVRIKKAEGEMGAYRHPRFRRGDFESCQKIIRVVEERKKKFNNPTTDGRSSGARKRAASASSHTSLSLEEHGFSTDDSENSDHIAGSNKKPRGGKKASHQVQGDLFPGAHNSNLLSSEIRQNLLRDNLEASRSVLRPDVAFDIFGSNGGGSGLLAAGPRINEASSSQQLAPGIRPQQNSPLPRSQPLVERSSWPPIPDEIREEIIRTFGVPSVPAAPAAPAAVSTGSRAPWEHESWKVQNEQKDSFSESFIEL